MFHSVFKKYLRGTFLCLKKNIFFIFIKTYLLFTKISKNFFIEKFYNSIFYKLDENMNEPKTVMPLQRVVPDRSYYEEYSEETYMTSLNEEKKEKRRIRTDVFNVRKPNPKERFTGPFGGRYRAGGGGGGSTLDAGTRQKKLAKAISNTKQQATRLGVHSVTVVPKSEGAQTMKSLNTGGPSIAEKYNLHEGVPREDPYIALPELMRSNIAKQKPDIDSISRLAGGKQKSNVRPFPERQKLESVVPIIHRKADIVNNNTYDVGYSCNKKLDIGYTSTKQVSKKYKELDKSEVDDGEKGTFCRMVPFTYNRARLQRPQQSNDNSHSVIRREKGGANKIIAKSTNRNADRHRTSTVRYPEELMVREREENARMQEQKKLFEKQRQERLKHEEKQKLAMRRKIEEKQRQEERQRAIEQKRILDRQRIEDKQRQHEKQRIEAKKQLQQKLRQLHKEQAEKMAKRKIQMEKELAQKNLRQQKRLEERQNTRSKLIQQKQALREKHQREKQWQQQQIQRQMNAEKAVLQAALEHKPNEPYYPPPYQTKLAQNQLFKARLAYQQYPASVLKSHQMFQNNPILHDMPIKTNTTKLSNTNTNTNPNANTVANANAITKVRSPTKIPVLITNRNRPVFQPKSTVKAPAPAVQQSRAKPTEQGKNRPIRAIFKP